LEERWPEVRTDAEKSGFRACLWPPYTQEWDECMEKAVAMLMEEL
jgi:hypothetical protein